MSEDRHTFSEPRPIPGLDLPTWDVDVFRDGVPEPILTLRIDETTLPPRKSKKKKVVWKLPDSVDQIPRFGIDEKRRLLDLFKNLKKERRKSKQKRGSAVNDFMGIEDAKSFDEPETNNNNIPKEEPLASGVQNVSLEGSSAVEPAPPPPSSKPQQPANGTHSRVTPAPPGLASSKAPPHRSISAPSPPGVPPPAMNGNSLNTPSPKPPPGLIRAKTDIVQSSTPPPPGLTPIAAPPKPPPPPKIKEPLNQQHLQPRPPPQLHQQPAPPTAQAAPPTQMQPPQPAPVSAPLPSSNPLSVPTPLLPPARYLKCPPGMHPDIFAQQVANLYITLLQSAQVDELLLYYTPSAQKSLSLKSAKSICQTPLERKTQLTSLVGCVFAVQGITLQRGLNLSLLLIWSGICQLQGQQHGFCHTIVLVPIPGAEENGLQYQIQNDALVLLTNE